jgi:hypothetical protein
VELKRQRGSLALFWDGNQQGPRGWRLCFQNRKTNQTAEGSGSFGFKKENRRPLWFFFGKGAGAPGQGGAPLLLFSGFGRGRESLRKW